MITKRGEPIMLHATSTAEKKRVGRVSHFYNGINVAVVEVEAPLKVGDLITIEGSTTNIQQKIDSMQVNHKNIHEAKKGDSIGMRVSDRVRINDIVYKTT